MVLDTHALIWWVSGDGALSRRAADAIVAARATGQLVVSAISAWEIAQLVARGRLRLSMDVAQWFASVTRIEGLRVHAVDADQFMQSVHLPGELHRDPADRLLIALTRSLGAALITCDQKIQQYPHVKTLW